MSNQILLTALPPELLSALSVIASENGYRTEVAATRDVCQEILLNQDILAILLNVTLVTEDPRIIEVLKFYSNSVQFILYSEDPAFQIDEVASRKDIVGVLYGAPVARPLFLDFLNAARRLYLLEKRIESVNFALQENQSAAAELNLKNKVLERERNFNESIISSIAYGLIIVDTEGAIMLLNGMGRKVFGITAEDVYGSNYETQIYESVRENLTAVAKETLATRQSREVDGFTVREDMIISYSVSVIKDNFENVIGLMFLGRDVTEWDQMTHQLFQAEKLATMGTMLSGIAHELRNPLTIINARAQRLLAGPSAELNDRARKAVESIEDQSKRCGEIINNLLDFSRKKVAGIVLANVNEIIDSALNFLAFEHRADGIEILRNFSENCIARCDKNQMEQVFLNLFTNACDAMAGSGNLVLTTENSENYIRISVRDTGPGISDEHKKKIFDPFFTTKEAGKGTGLGLAIVYKIIQAHKGRLVLRSKVGQGTTFIILLPKVQ
ncbi:MAG: ATP-binding protein [Fibrobacterota bacterium]